MGTSNRSLFLLVAALGSFSAFSCTSASKTQPVRISYSEIPRGSVSPPAAEPAVTTSIPSGGEGGSRTAPTSISNAAAQPPVDAELESSPDAAAAPVVVSTREIIDRALGWATEGLQAYLRGQYGPAFDSLDGARVVLLEADMPEFWKSQGLAVLQAGLPADLKRHDLVAVHRELEAARANDPREKAESAYVETELKRILRRFGEAEPERGSLAELVRETHLYIDFYRGRGREFFERTHLRKRKYWPIVQEVFGERNLPIELGYIAFVESGFSPRAQSHADAWGLWQFIPETGRRYGLAQRNDFFDTRKSTEAAAEYLIDLLSIFGSPSFLLAAASYNAGEGKILSCLRRIDDPFEKRTFWEIRGCLVTETREYVPRVLAAAVLSSDPARFGLAVPNEQEIDERYEIVDVPTVMPLSRLAELSGTTVEQLRQANTEISSSADATPGRNFPLYVPIAANDTLSSNGAPGLSGASGAEALAAALAALPPDPEVAAPRDDETPSTRTTRYRVRRGDTLGKIASRHKVSLETLARNNRLRKPYRLTVGQMLTIAKGSSGSARTSENAESGSQSDAGSNRIVLTVRRGHTLGEIADLFDVSVRDLMRWNSLSSTVLSVGKKLTIHPSRRYRTRTYQVRRGDQLPAIARRFGISVASLCAATGRGAGERLKTGEKLTFYTPG